MLAEIENQFRPEFLNRVDDTIVFRTLTRDDLREIVELELDKVMKRLDRRDIELEVTDQAMELMIEHGYNPDFGARPLRRAIEFLLEDPLSEEILRGTLESGRVVAERNGDELSFTQEESSRESGEEHATTAAKS